MTLTLLPLYLKTIIKHQIYHSIQFTSYDSFYYTQLGCSSFQDQLCNHRKYHRSSPTATHKEDNQKISHAPTSLHNGLPYVHATGLTNFNTSISTNPQLLTSMTLISPSSYLKTIIKYQTSLSIQCTLYESFYYIPLGCLSYQD